MSILLYDHAFHTPFAWAAIGSVRRPSYCVVQRPLGAGPVPVPKRLLGLTVCQHEGNGPGTMDVLPCLFLTLECPLTVLAT